MLRCHPFLLFDGTCAEAMAFYQSCFGGELRITKLGDSPMKDLLPPDKHGRIINAHLKSDAVEISATDWMAAPQYEPSQGDTTAIFVIADHLEELKKVFDKLADGASKDRFQDIRDLPFGSYGQLTDKFGTRWIFKGPHSTAAN